MKNFPIEIDNQEIVREGVKAIIDFYRTLSVKNVDLPGAAAFVTHVDSPFLNVLIDFRTDRHNSSALKEEVNDFFDQYHCPWAWFVVPAGENDLNREGFSLLEEAPAMYFDLFMPLPSLDIDFLTIEELLQGDNLSTWIQPINEGFNAEEGDDSYQKLNADLLQQGEKKLKHYVGYYHNEVAAAATLFLSDNAVMIHNVATKKKFKKKGIGTKLTLHLMEQAKLLGYQHCFLDASEEAFNLYQKIGFKVCHTTLVYKKD